MWKIAALEFRKNPIIIDWVNYVEHIAYYHFAISLLCVCGNNFTFIEYVYTRVKLVFLFKLAVIFIAVIEIVNELFFLFWLLFLLSMRKSFYPNCINYHQCLLWSLRFDPIKVWFFCCLSPQIVIFISLMIQSLVFFSTI